MNIQHKIYLVSVIGAVIIVVLAVFGFGPLVLEIKKTAALALESREKLISLEIMDKNYIENTEKDYQEIEARVEEIIKNRFIDKSEAVKFFEALEAIAASTNNQIEISVADFPLLNLSLKGSFADLMKFLGWLENGPYLIDVRSLGISRVGSLNEETENVPVGTIKSNIKINVYTHEKN